MLTYYKLTYYYFWNAFIHVSDSYSAHHQEFFTVNTAMVYVIQFCRQLAKGIRMELVWFCCRRIRTELQFRPDPARKLSTNLYDIYHFIYHYCVNIEKLLVMDTRTVQNS